MKQVIQPKMLYFGTPVVLISTLNEDGSPNIAPMSSAWWQGACLRNPLRAARGEEGPVARKGPQGDVVHHSRAVTTLAGPPRHALRVGVAARGMLCWARFA